MTDGHRPRKRFGQHFLVDPGTRAAIVDAIAAAAGDTVVEIGPGHGALTAPLIASGARLYAIEVDRDLASALEERWADVERFTLLRDDALDVDFSRFGRELRLVGNLPYNISTALLFHLLESVDSIHDMHFMLQKEVVDRMAAEPGGKRYGRLTVMLGVRARVERLFDVPPTAFDPPPKVTSSVVRIEPRPEGELRIGDAARFKALVTAAFSKRRKTLRNALSPLVSANELTACDIDPGARPETLDIAKWVELANRIGES